MTSALSRSWRSGALVLALISLTGGGATALDFGEPIEPVQTPEQHVRAILADYVHRKAELLEVGFSPAVEIVIGILAGAGQESAAILTPIRALGFLGRPQGSAAVSRYIAHPDRQVRLAAIRSLGQMGKFDAIPIIKPSLQSPDREERGQAIIALGKFAKPELIPEIELAAGSDPEFLKLAAEAKARIKATVQSIQSQDYTSLVNAVIDTDEYEDILTLILVTWRPMLAILEDESRTPRTRERVLRLLAMARIRKAGPPMRKLLADPAQPMMLRLRAAYGLGLTRTRSSVPQLAALLSSTEPGMTEVSVLAMGRLGDPTALQPLLDHWAVASPKLRNDLRLAIARVAKTPALTSLLEPLRAYRKAAIERVWFISGTMDIIAGFNTAVLFPYFTSASASARRDALLLAANLVTRQQSDVLSRTVTFDSDPLNVEIARLGLERLKDIPIWERP